jgi:hypothetical protein
MVEIRVTAVPSPSRKALGIGERTLTTKVWCRNISP